MQCRALKVLFCDASRWRLQAAHVIPESSPPALSTDQGRKKSKEGRRERLHERSRLEGVSVSDKEPSERMLKYLRHRSFCLLCNCNCCLLALICC